MAKTQRHHARLFGAAPGGAPVAVLAGCFILGASTIGAGAEVISQSDLVGLIDSLGAPEFVIREAATDRLESFDGPIEAMIRDHLTTGDLSHEQLARIETVLESRFRAAPRAALGVGFKLARQANNRVRQIPVILGKVLAGFPCSATLRLGDIIRVVDGFELPATGGGDRVRTAILSHLPGEELELLIERNGRRSFLRIPLGEYARLNNPMPTEAMLKSAWALRKARLGLTAADARQLLPCVVDGERASMPALPRRDEPDLEAGGSPDNGAALLHLLRSRASTIARSQIAARNALRFNIAQPNQRRLIVLPQVRATTDVALRVNLKIQLDRIINDRDRYLRIVAREDIAQDQRQSAIAQLAEIEANIAAIKKDLRNLEEPEKKTKANPQD